MFAPARQAEIIRSNQKDEYYMSFIRGSIADICQAAIGPHSWLHWRKELDLIADVLYFGLTTFAGFQTLGEEYVNIIQVDSSLRKIPSRLQRGFMILCHAVAPYCIDRLLDRLQQRLGRPDVSAELSRFAAIIPAVRHAVTIIHRCHLATFYLHGIFYHVAKRLAGTRYLQVRRATSAVSQSNYRILGWLSLTQLLFTFLRHLYQFWCASAEHTASTETSFLRSMLFPPQKHSNLNATENSEDYAPDSRNKCVLCLERCKNSTVTPCGHLFCWDCIVEWCSTKAECPLCREQFSLSRLVPLQNYDVV